MHRNNRKTKIAVRTTATTKHIQWSLQKSTRKVSIESAVWRIDVLVKIVAFLFAIARSLTRLPVQHWMIDKHFDGSADICCTKLSRRTRILFVCVLVNYKSWRSFISCFVKKFLSKKRKTQNAVICVCMRWWCANGSGFPSHMIKISISPSRKLRNRNSQTWIARNRVEVRCGETN